MGDKSAIEARDKVCCHICLLQDKTATLFALNVTFASMQLSLCGWSNYVASLQSHCVDASNTLFLFFLFRSFNFRNSARGDW